MKCPYRKETHTQGDWVTENFGECHKHECPFYERTNDKQSFDRGKTWETVYICRRAKNESEGK